MYQWGRKYGQGNPDSYNVQIIEGPVTLNEGQSSDNADCFFKSNSTENNFDWQSDPDSQLWNIGTIEEPIKTEYDPCPSGWRVPTGVELKDLLKNYSSYPVYVNAVMGRWFSGSSTYSESVARVFLPMAGYISAWSGYSYMNQNLGTYWSSSADENSASCWEFSTSAPSYVVGIRADGKSIRCVKE